MSGAGVLSERRKVSQRVYLAALSVDGVITSACKAAGISRGLPTIWRQDPEFYAKEKEALEKAADSLEQVAVDGAKGRWEKIALYQGAPIRARDPETGELMTNEDGSPVYVTYNERSERMLEMMLKARRPGSFGAKQVDVKVTGSVSVGQIGLGSLPREARLALLAALEEGGALLEDATKTTDAEFEIIASEEEITPSGVISDDDDWG